ncbi:MAG: hypothetical protein QW775_04015 [Ignisphaera sp.]|uniref:Uncharacterized protein n=1 Tax=Ignisphaera aggregans TaxID=334771 RepID=A0A7C4NL51_9CREN
MNSQICIDLASRCISVTVFDYEGKKVKEFNCCNIESVELSGLVRLTFNERIIKDIMCLVLESLSIEFELKGSTLKIKTS